MATAKKIALITGANKGLGFEMARQLGQEGVRVLLAARDSGKGEAAAAKLRDEGLDAQFLRLDVTDKKDRAAAFAFLAEKFGRLDILINNAGIELTSLLIDIEAEDMRRMCDVNILGTALGIKHAFRAMRPGGAAGAGGAIVNVSSVAATIAYPAIAGYSATKSAVDRMTRIGAMEAGKLGYGVRVNCIYPGLAPTEMGMKLATDIAALGLAADVNAAVGSVIEQTPLGRLADISEIADAAVFLCSSEARFITGVGLPVDGGMGT